MNCGVVTVRTGLYSDWSSASFLGFALWFQAGVNLPWRNSDSCGSYLFFQSAKRYQLAPCSSKAALRRPAWFLSTLNQQGELFAELQAARSCSIPSRLAADGEALGISIIGLEMRRSDTTNLRSHLSLLVRRWFPKEFIVARFPRAKFVKLPVNPEGHEDL